ncbi:MAG: hypothetical protein H7Z41_11335 [Cytophagales bacterium]|nr:hypothetical protein [Armatimonadota bacterium]
MDSTNTLSTFDELDRTLGQEETPWGNYWNEYARELAPSLSEADWDALGRQWQSRTLNWQCHYAEILDGTDSEYALPVLIEMVQAQDEDLVITAADSLRGFAPPLVAGSMTPPMRQRLQQIAQTRGSVYEPVLKALLDALDKAA